MSDLFRALRSHRRILQPGADLRNYDDWRTDAPDPGEIEDQPIVENRKAEEKP